MANGDNVGVGDAIIDSVTVSDGVGLILGVPVGLGGILRDGVLVG